MSIKSIGSLSSEQVDSLIKKLDEAEFEFFGLIIFWNRGISRADRVGHIYVKYPKCHLPVGFISAREDKKYDFKLVNTDVEFPEDYHSKLREIYSLV